MNKKEQKQLDDALTLAAFHRTTPVFPDVEIPKTYDVLSTGFLCLGSVDIPFASPACSSSVFHSRHSNTKTTTQGAIKLFSTKALALKAARYEAELHFCAALRRIDKQIEAASASESALPNV